MIKRRGLKRAHNEITLQLALRTCRCRNGVKVVNVVVEHDVDPAGGEAFLDLLAILVRVRRVEKLRVRVNNGDLLARERVLDLASEF